MIAVVNPNVGMDYLLYFKGFRKNATLRASRAEWGLGGKGLVSAYVMASLGWPVWITGFSGGIFGEMAERILRSRGVEVEFVEAHGAARLNVVLKDEEEDWQSTITAPGVVVDKGHEKELLALVEARLKTVSCLVLGGSLPHGCGHDLYCELIGLAAKRGVPSILDTSGEALREATKARPTAVKPNQYEAEDLLGRKITGLEEALQAAEEIHGTGMRWVVITLGARGLVAFGDGQAWYAWPPPLRPRSTAGAGDAVVAGLAIGLASGWGIERALKLGLAAAAALMERGDPVGFDPDRVNFWLQRVSVFPSLSKGPSSAL